MLWLDCACMMGSSETGWHASTKYVIHCINISYNLFSFSFSLLLYPGNPSNDILHFVAKNPFFCKLLSQINLFCKFWQRKTCLQIAVSKNCLCKHSKSPTIRAKTSLLIWDIPQKYFSHERCFLIRVISDQTKWTLILTKTFFERLWVPEVVAVGGRLRGPGGLRRAIVAERPSPRN